MGRDILILEEDTASCRTCQDMLASAEFTCHVAHTTEQARSILTRKSIAMVLCSAALERGGSLEFLANCRKAHPGLPIVLMTAEASLDEAIRALRAGASDYLVQPIPPATLMKTCERVVAERDATIQAYRCPKAAFCPEIQNELIGTSRAIREVGRLIEAAASTSTTVLLTGDSGTGKEVVSRAIHRATSVRQGPFVAINCAALPESLLEGELFGHRKGAFTGAHADKIGFFEAARGGTLFLDEIGELPLALQPKLLRAIERKEIVRVGDTHAVPVDVRLIAATNRDLKKACSERTFREDLYYRLHVLVIPLPTLRERREDIALLVDHFVSRLNRELKRTCLGLGPEALGAVLAHDWPGNVRELENAIERAMLVASGPYLTPSDLGLSNGRPEPAVEDVDNLNAALARFEAEHIRRVLIHVQGNREKAAHRLGISASTLYRKLNELGLHPVTTQSQATLGS